MKGPALAKPVVGLEEWSAIKTGGFQDTNQAAQKHNPKMSWEPPKHNPTCQTSTAQANRDLRNTQRPSQERKGNICRLLEAALSLSFFYSCLEDVSACKYLEEEEDNFPFGVFTFSLATKQKIVTVWVGSPSQPAPERRRKERMPQFTASWE